MSANARMLREFRIDDSIDDETADRAIQAGEPLINGFLTAQEVFRAIGRDTAPELVLIDVNFDQDQSDPLAAYGKRPTGLLYALCFLTWARVVHRPIGIGFHTADAGLWIQCESSMRDLAVLLVGLNASLTDSAKEARLLHAGEIEEAVEWLESRAGGNENEGRLKAAEDFRRCLQVMANPNNVVTSRLVIDPTNHVKLLSACEELGKLSEDDVVGEHELLRSLGVLIFIDGKSEPECLSVNGLFPNVVGGLLAQDFRPLSLQGGVQSTKRRNTENSNDSSSPELWRYDRTKGQRPLVRAYLESLGQWQEVYEGAKVAANSFGSGEANNEEEQEKDLGAGQHGKRETSLLHRLIPSGDSVYLKRFIAAAFGIVRLYKTAWDNWCKEWNKEQSHPWPAREDECKSATTKQRWLDDLLATIQVLRENNEMLYEADIAQKLMSDLKWHDVMTRSHHISSWLIEYLRLLQAIGCVTTGSDETGTYWHPTQEVDGSDKQVPLNPLCLPQEYRPNWLSAAGLAVSVGYGTDGTQFTRLHENVKLPDKTLQNMASGSRCAPSWLVPLCAQYAREIGFLDKNGWPEFMQFGEQAS